MSIWDSNTVVRRKGGCSEVKRTGGFLPDPRLAAFVVVVLCGAGSAPAAWQSVVPCSRWGEATVVGALDEAYIDEASGLATSGESGERLFLINDSGDLGRFYVTAADGSRTEVVAIEGFEPVDVEDIARGRCPGGDGSCLFIADIGDNAARRAETEIVVVREQSPFPASVQPERRIRVRYPDGPRDAESVAFHPNGDLIILTKTADYSTLRVAPSILYRLAYERWAQGGGDVQVAERIGELALAAVSSDAFSGSLPTAMDISGDGGRFLVLTYLNAFEFYFDLSEPFSKPAAEMVEGVDYREIPVPALQQQESIAYLPSGRGFLFTTEGGGPEGVPLMRVTCEE